MFRRELAALAACACVSSCGSDAPTFPDAGPTEDAGGRVDVCTPAQPCPIGPVATENVGFIDAVGDQDPWVFDVPRAGLVIDLVVFNDALRSPVQLETALFGPGGVGLVNRRAESSRVRQRVELQLVAPSAGTYTLEVRDVGADDRDPNNPYFVGVELVEGGDDNEPNDTQAAGTPITLGEPIRGAIEVQGDEDWFRVDLTAGRRLRVRATAVEGEVRHRWSLWAPDGVTRRVDSTERSPWPEEIRALTETGTYFLLMEDDPSDGAQANPEQLYTLTVDELPEPDELERPVRNDTFDTATVVRSGTPTEGYIASIGDVDWYALDVDGVSEADPRILTAEVAYGADSPVDLQMTVYEPDGETFVCERRDGDRCKAYRFTWDEEQGYPRPNRLSTAHPVTQPGRYLVEVRDLRDDDIDDAQPYTVTLELREDPDVTESYRGSSRSAARSIVASTATTGAVIQFPWVEGWISYAEDTDWYVFEIPGEADAVEGGNRGVQNGDWLVRIELQVPGPTPVELQAFFLAEDRDYDGYGRRCRRPDDDAPLPREFLCDYDPATNGIDLDFQTSLDGADDDCFVVFREVTDDGPHYWRISDLDRNDFDLGPGGRYRFRMTVTAGCPAESACGGRFLRNGADLCGRP